MKISISQSPRFKIQKERNKGLYSETPTERSWCNIKVLISIFIHGIAIWTQFKILTGWKVIIPPTISRPILREKAEKVRWKEGAIFFSLLQPMNYIAYQKVRETMWCMISSHDANRQGLMRRSVSACVESTHLVTVSWW